MDISVIMGAALVFVLTPGLGGAIILSCTIADGLWRGFVAGICGWHWYSFCTLYAATVAKISHAYIFYKNIDFLLLFYPCYMYVVGVGVLTCCSLLGVHLGKSF